MSQLEMFVDDFSDKTFDYGKGKFKEDIVEIEEKNTPTYDRIMSVLSKMADEAQKQNEELESLLNKLQSDWTDDEKLQVKDLKEWARQQKLKEEQKPKEPIIMKELSIEAIDILKVSKVEGLVVKLPEGQLDRDIYLEVKNRLELIGGKWKGGKIMGFVFQENPTELLEQIANGEKRNLKKEFQFFGTPDELADELVELAFDGFRVQNSPLSILEPSAGQGAIVKAINRKTGGNDVHCYEAMPVNKTILNKISTVVFLGEDFFNDNGDKFDLIIANPPFSKNQDIVHILKMWSVLNKGGRIVTIASKHWQLSNNKKEVEFRKFLEENKAEIIEIEAGRFKESGTMIASVIIVLNKV